MNWTLCEAPGLPTAVLTARGEVHTHKEAQVFVHDLNLIVTVQVLDETPAVLSLGQLCEDHGYSFEWVSGPKPRLTKDGKTIICKNGQFRSSCRSTVIQSILEAFRLLPRHHRTRREEKWKIASGDSRRSASSSSSSPA